MRHILIYLCLMAVCPGVQSKVQLVQSGAEIKKPGESVKISCKTSGFTFTSVYMHWIRQAPGKGLVWVGRIDPENSETKYSESFNGRFTITTDNSFSTTYLQLNSLRTEDTAVYYCARVSWSSAIFEYWGQGTMVTVTSVSATAPSVFPLTSCTGEVTSPQVTFGCLAKGYFPEPVTVTWSPNVSSSGVRTYPSVLQPSSSLYSLSSQVTVPASSWESNTYRCTVEHQPTSSSISKEIPKPPVPEPTAPEVEVFYSCTTNPGTVQLVCLISGFSPKPLTVEWLVDGEHGLLHSDLYPVKKDPDSHTYSIRSNSSVPQSEWLTGKTYTCQVYHQGTATTKQAHARMCEGDSPQG